MRIDVITLFPEVFGPLHSSIPARAQDKGLLELHLHWLREFGAGPHHQVDDTPFGGGPGMVMTCGPIFDCLDTIPDSPERLVIYPTPQGKPFLQQDAIELASQSHLVFVCGHYEGVDQRVRDTLVDREYSIGDYVLSSGELSSMVIADAVIRLIPGVIKPESYQQDSFFKKGLDHPHYTKPADFRGLQVPEVLLSGHHKNIEKWREERAMETTRKVRPDLL
ncbi:MAG TPA: tRNA (guanosine(37)-N1)-methyltransferase TrmD [Phycisphaerales bacterium]|nr:tRNA (guanosine(37)-N1)-methyltransferase TrmD [Phycisphaerales bacterium]